MKRSFLFLILSLLTLSVKAQKTFDLKDYLPMSVGAEWQYKNLTTDGLSPIIVRVESKEKFQGKDVLKRTENNGDYRLQSFEREGLIIYQLYFVDGRFIEYEKPVLLIPAKMRLGETHKTEVNYKTLLNGKEQEKGIQTYETKIERIENVSTSLGTFKDCLLIRTTALRTASDGKQKGYELLEWHAKGIGAVRVVGELFWKNEKGETTRTFKINAELEKFSSKSK